jgi:hypothetical protein
MYSLTHQSATAQTLDVETNSAKRDRSSSNTEEGEDEGEELIPRKSIPIPFSSILDDSTISSKQLCEVMTYVFPLKK